MKYFDKVDQVEVDPGDPSIDGAAIPNERVIALPDDNPFFHPLPAGKEVHFSDAGIPIGLIDEAGPTLTEAKAAKLYEINSEADLFLSAITEEYPESERLSWDKQEQEARNWLADNSVATPLLDAIAVGRGLSKPVLAQKVVEKADNFAAVSGLIFGKRQAFEDQVVSIDDATGSVGDVEAITVSY